jgi:hypothetical protein
MVFPVFQDSVITALQYPVGFFLAACLNSGKDFLKDDSKKIQLSLTPFPPTPQYLW